MEVRNKTFDILQSKYSRYLSEEVFYNGGNYGGYNLGFDQINASVFIEYDSIEGCKYIQARCRWSYTSVTDVCRFDFSWEDFIRACKWLDKKRVEFAGQLL